MDMLITFIVVIISEAYTCVKTCEIVHYKYAKCIVCQYTLIKLLKNYILSIPEHFWSWEETASFF